MSISRWILVGLCVGVALVALGWTGAFTSRAAQDERDAEAARSRGIEAFTTVARVLRHPRCLNCHPTGDRPRIGDERELHAMNVQRGPEGHGVPGLRCAACHQPENQDLAGVPGAPHWHLAPLSMGWEGLDDHELAKSLVDRSKNGDRSLTDLRGHMARDPLVLWGWDPGVGRSKPPVSHGDFLEALDAWIESGAPAPAPGTTTF